MKLQKLLSSVDVIRIKGSVIFDINSIEIDSKNITKNSLYICLKGERCDGHDFISEAEKYGAVAIICEKETNTKLTQIIVSDSRKALAIVSKNFYERACDNLKIVGVTGTNGKTSTTHFIRKILVESGVKCGVIGTLGAFYDDVKIDTSLTTPDPIQLHEIFYKMWKANVEVVVMEVSAHALYYDKLYGVNFEIGVLTNFTQDHLDFFGTMENYENAKNKFFQEFNFKYAVINADDNMGIKILNSGIKCISFGLYNPSDVFAIDVICNKNGSKFVLNLFDCIFDVELKSIGEFNVYNAMCSACVCALLGVDTVLIGGKLNGLTPINGRMEEIFNKNFSIFVDYAHTPDGLKKALTALKCDCKGRLICLFGCGGNRDVEKRKIMGEISGDIADFTIITSDNPRFEEPMSIINQIELGVIESGGKYVIIERRNDAIEYAINIAKDKDVILIAGKGNENYQEILGIKHYFNDKDTVKNLIGEII